MTQIKTNFLKIHSTKIKNTTTRWKIQLHDHKPKKKEKEKKFDPHFPIITITKKKFHINNQYHSVSLSVHNPELHYILC